MEQETLLEKAIHALVFLAICAAIMGIGWNEPLRYRFMSPQEIAEAEGMLNDEPPPPKPSSWSPGPSRLDESSRYRSSGRGEIFSLPERKADGLAPPPDRASGTRTR